MARPHAVVRSAARGASVTAPARDRERETLAFFLAAQRSSVLAIIDGLADDELTRTIVPSGWTVAGTIEHLGDAEGAWFQLVVAGGSIESNATPAAQGVADALAYYRAQIARSDEILAATPLAARPVGRPVADIGIADEHITVRDVVLHVIEETARHAGHLDIARELLDGRTGLGAR